jgi:DNA-binding PadR family transcriptional regulator
MGNLYRFVEPVTLYLLKVRGRIHGYDLTGALNDNALTDSRIEPAALYRTLRRLEESGMVVSAWDVSGCGPARRIPCPACRKPPTFRIYAGFVSEILLP